jgi:hypothetical protein
MMKDMQTIWRLNPGSAPVPQGGWLGSLIAAMETEFSISCCFVVLPEHRQRVLSWLEAKAIGPYSVKELPDEQIAVAVGKRQDAVRLRAIHRYGIDQSVIVANRSAEQVNGFIGQIKSRLAS